MLFFFNLLNRNLLSKLPPRAAQTPRSKCDINGPRLFTRYDLTGYICRIHPDSKCYGQCRLSEIPSEPIVFRQCDRQLIKGGGTTQRVDDNTDRKVEHVAAAIVDSGNGPRLCHFTQNINLL